MPAFKGWEEKYQTMEEMEEDLKGVVSGKGKEKKVSSEWQLGHHSLMQMKTENCLLGLVPKV